MPQPSCNQCVLSSHCHDLYAVACKHRCRDIAVGPPRADLLQHLRPVCRTDNAARQLPLNNLAPLLSGKER